MDLARIEWHQDSGGGRRTRLGLNIRFLAAVCAVLVEIAFALTYLHIDSSSPFALILLIALLARCYLHLLRVFTSTATTTTTINQTNSQETSSNTSMVVCLLACNFKMRA